MMYSKSPPHICSELCTAPDAMYVSDSVVDLPPQLPLIRINLETCMINKKSE